MANIHHTISEVKKLNPELARQIEKYVKEHSYGLVFEEDLPEAVRLWKKTITVGDTVNILPPRGQFETDENKKAWLVIKVSSETATVQNDNETKEVKLDDLVTTVSYKDVIYPGLKEIDRIERGDPDDPYHMVINAENYHALQVLIYAYAGKVDCIYIDPPYNKQNSRDWKYNCDYVDRTDRYRHSKWLAFMKRRLKLAKKLLNPEDSVLIVTIDEVEYARLGLLLEQLFPEAKIQMISDVINPKGVSRNGFRRNDEYIYFVMIGNSKPCELNLNDEWSSSASISIESNNNNNPGWTSMMRRGNNSSRKHSPGCYYPIYVDPKTKTIKQIGQPLPDNKHKSDEINGLIQVLPIRTNGDEGVWQISPKELKERLEQGRIKLGRETNYGYVINYLPKGAWERIQNGSYIIDGYDPVDKSIITHKAEGYNEEKIPPTQWKISSHNASENGTCLIQSILKSDRFQYPKSIYSIYDVLKLFLKNKSNALIVDFFAGSGTTIHSTCLLNESDKGHRKCICITNNEVSKNEEDELTHNKISPKNSEWQDLGIANHVTWPRVVSSIKGVDVNGDCLGYNILNNTYSNYGSNRLVYRKNDIPLFCLETSDNTSKKEKLKKLHNSSVYKLVSEPAYPELSNLKMSDGFKANAIFCELTYESEWPIRLDNAFNAIAPLLWMQAGCRGKIIDKRVKTYSVTDYYGVLFDYYQASKFCDEVNKRPNLRHVFVVTDDQRRYSNICRRLPNHEVHRLYETFLKTFQICGEGGLD